MSAFKNFLLILLIQFFMCNVPIASAKEKSRIIKSEVLSPKQQMAEHTEVLRDLMLQLYTLYPNELAKSTQVGAREMTEWVFDGKANWKFEAIRSLQGKEALALIFEPTYHNDVVLPLVVGLETLLFTSYGAKNEFDIPLEINAVQLLAAYCDIQMLNQQLNNASTTHAKAPIEKLVVNKNVHSHLNQTLHRLSMRLLENSDVKKTCNC